MSKHRCCASALVAAVLGIAACLGGCMTVKAPETIDIGIERHQPVDTTRVPPTASHEEARQRLAEAYGEVRYLQAKVRDLEEDKAKLRRERDEYKEKYKHEKDKYDD